MTAGANLSGAKITASFLNGGSETLTWAKIKNQGDGKGGVLSSQGWSLTQAGDSFVYPWILQADASISLAALTIDLFGGNAAFDTEEDANAASNTDGSFQGVPFTVKPGFLRPDSVVYSTPIDISNGDLFSTLTLRWDNGFSNSLLKFVADTDSGTSENPVAIAEPPAEPAEPPVAPPLVTLVETPPSTTRVPEPSVLLGLLAIAGLGRRLNRGHDTELPSGSFL
ncbi:MAG: PEP-CTERM sorting domain-containing protein [Synechococcales cyanobacterium RU_4_20]|nr:PEP-CTERM sorting domain-containing protein [Synechococcales cyanobacterium RU_4_20]